MIHIVYYFNLPVHKQMHILSLALFLKGIKSGY